MPYKTPLVSVIIPCFNLGAYLDEAVDSVLAQSLQDFEILIVDDGSTDPATRARLEAYERPHTAVFHTANQGLAKARNLLVSKARGQFLCALDADDRLHPEFLARTSAALLADPHLTFVSTRLRMFGDQEDTWPQTERCDLPAMLADVTVITASLVRRDAVQAVGGFDEHMPVQGDEDWDLWLRLLENGYRGMILPEILFYYRRRADSMSAVSSHGEARLQSILYLATKHQRSYQEHFLPVMLSRETEISALRRAIVHLEADINGRLLPAVALREQERDQLQARQKAIRAEDQAARNAPSPDAQQVALASLQDAYARARAEVDALRESASWRITAPLRAVYDWSVALLRWRP